MRKFLLLSCLFSSLYMGTTACGGGDDVESLCKEGEVIREGQCLLDIHIGVNSVGFLPQRNKRATYAGQSADFEIVDKASGSVEFSGTAEGPMTAEDTGETVYVADFTEVTKTGTYFVRADGKESAPFQISAEIMNDALETTMLGLYGQRCGEGVDIDHQENHFTHGACHLVPASTERLPEDLQEGGTKEDTGGWHDAGDYGKYVRNGAFAVAFLLKAYEQFPDSLKDVKFQIPENTNETPDILDEARVELAWILKAQLLDGSFSHKVTGLKFEGEVAPQADSNPRYFYTASSTATATAVAVLAMGARLYEEFDEDFATECLEAALAGQKHLEEHPEEFDYTEVPSGGTGSYDDGGSDADERAWAQVEMWATTGEAKYLSAYELVAPELGIQNNFDWPDTRNLALATYLDIGSAERDAGLVEEMTVVAVRSADAMVEDTKEDPYGRGLSAYYWGSTGVTARMALNLVMAHKAYPNRDYLDSISQKVDYLLGRNSFARSFVTGLGANPPKAPHHRPSVSDAVADPWPGLLIGGPNGDAASWTDKYESYQTNEVAINWNTALVYALAAAQATATDEDAECVPDCVGPVVPDGDGGAGGGSP